MKQFVIPIDSIENKEQAQYLLIPIEVGAGFTMILCRDEDLEPSNAEQRREAQNALMWQWNNQKAKASGERPEFVHGLDKLQILLPLYKSWGGRYLKRAMFIESVLDQLTKFETKVGVAYDMVRTRNLSIKKMAEYLTQVQQESARNGFSLESNKDLEFKNLMTYVER